MKLGRILFYLFVAYLIFMLIGRIVSSYREDQSTNQTPQQSQKSLQELDKTMREGLLAARKGDQEEAEKQFMLGRALADSLNEQEFHNHFTMMLINLYLDMGALDNAETLLKEANTQPGIDKISYNNQLAVLYEKQGKHDKMCQVLLILQEGLLPLNCEKHMDDVKILETQKDENAIKDIFRKPEIEAIVNCAGKRMIDKKITDNQCKKEITE